MFDKTVVEYARKLLSEDVADSLLECLGKTSSVSNEDVFHLIKWAKKVLVDHEACNVVREGVIASPMEQDRHEVTPKARSDHSTNIVGALLERVSDLGGRMFALSDDSGGPPDVSLGRQLAACSRLCVIEDWWHTRYIATALDSHYGWTAIAEAITLYELGRDLSDLADDGDKQAATLLDRLYPLGFEWHPPEQRDLFKDDEDAISGAGEEEA